MQNILTRGRFIISKLNKSSDGSNNEIIITKIYALDNMAQKQEGNIDKNEEKQTSHDNDLKASIVDSQECVVYLNRK